MGGRERFTTSYHVQAGLNMVMIVNANKYNIT